MIRLRRYAPLQALRRADYLPALAGGIAFAVGLVNLVSTLTPTIAWRDHLLLQLEPVEAVPLFHTLAVPASMALLVVAFYLQARRHRAWQIAVVLMPVLGVLSLLKGLDFEEALLSFAAAGVLWWRREAFYVRHRPLRRMSPMPLAAAGIAAACGSLLAWTAAAHQLNDEAALVPGLARAVCVAALLVVVAALFRPLGAPGDLPDFGEREAAAELVREHGRDTLAFFKLRRDAHYRFTGDRRAFLGYRVANNVMLVAGDPVGPPDALPALVADTCSFAQSRGLRIAALGASEELLPVYRRAGLRALYIGDEAIVDTGGFSLEGRSIRKVRQSVSRIEAAGFAAEAVEVDALGDEAIAALDTVSEQWRAGAPERGFTMAMDALGGAYQAGSVVVLARDGDGAVRGYLHFVPSFGRDAMSLSSMRRDRSTPNGLMEYLVVRAIELLRERGVTELSLNFAAFGRWIERPNGRVEQALGRAVGLANPFFQIESLQSFTAKFGPRWEPRYLVYERRRGLPRVGLAALRIEGQLPKLRS